MACSATPDPGSEHASAISRAAAWQSRVALIHPTELSAHLPVAGSCSLAPYKPGLPLLLECADALLVVRGPSRRALGLRLATQHREESQPLLVNPPYEPL